jgi:hypothetical protein
MMKRQHAALLLSLLMLSIFLCYTFSFVQMLSSRDNSNGTAIRKRPIPGAIRSVAPYNETEKGIVVKNVFLSLWLLPPENEKYQIEKLMKRCAQTNRGPLFEAHVTVVGGIPCNSDQTNMQKVAEKLQDRLAGSGPVPTTFSKVPSKMGTWSQALVFQMNQNSRFLELCKTARSVLGMETHPIFPPPINEPHLSIWYGTGNVPEECDIESIPDFEATALALWLTDPSTLEGVPQWKEVARISLI